MTPDFAHRADLGKREEGEEARQLTGRLRPGMDAKGSWERGFWSQFERKRDTSGLPETGRMPSPTQTRSDAGEMCRVCGPPRSAQKTRGPPCGPPPSLPPAHQHREHRAPPPLAPATPDRRNPHPPPEQSPSPKKAPPPPPPPPIVGFPAADSFALIAAFVADHFAGWTNG